MRSEAGSAERRLHPASLVFRVGRHARGLLLPAAVVYFFSRGETWQVWLAALFVPILLFDVFRYLTLRWRYDAEELVLREGWIFRSERHIPYARIQNVDLKQNVLHRALSVAEVTIETAGGVEPEASLSVVSLTQYDELRQRAFAGRASGGAEPGTRSTPADQPADAAPAAAETVLQLAPSDVLLLGLNPGRGLALVAIAWGALRELGLFEGWEESVNEATADPDSIAALARYTTALLFVGGIAALFALSLGGAFVEFFGFRLEDDGPVFRVRRGLFTREVLTIPKGRIQVVSVERPWFLALLGRARVEVRTAGGIDTSGGGRGRGGRHFAPIVRVERVPELLARIRPGLALDGVSWRPLARRAPRRFLVAALLPALPLAGLSVVFFEWIGAGIAAAILGLALTAGVRRARRAGWARASWGIAVRAGAFSTSEHATFDDKIQCVDLLETPFDRRHRHATLRVDTAGALLRQGVEVAIPYLDRAEAETLRAELVGAAVRARFRW
ncbi:MAG: PH domain-containing protein [Planctomycetes bacterium]|nr:PH domain-containing protein [Planctomycetota bacterium]